MINSHSCLFIPNVAFTYSVQTDFFLNRISRIAENFILVIFFIDLHSIYYIEWKPGRKFIRKCRQKKIRIMNILYSIETSRRVVRENENVRFMNVFSYNEVQFLFNKSGQYGWISLSCNEKKLLCGYSLEIKASVVLIYLSFDLLHIFKHTHTPFQQHKCLPLLTFIILAVRSVKLTKLCT